MGFVFVRVRPGPQGSVAETFAPYAADFADYRLDDLAATGPAWTSEIAVNWKSVRDVDNEGYHVAMAHPALQDLYGSSYADFVSPEGLAWSTAQFNAHGGRRWSVRHYLKILPDQPKLPEDKRRSWAYFGIFPNAVFTMTPEGVQFYQELPLGTDRTLIRSMSYRRPDEDRRTAPRPLPGLSHRPRDPERGHPALDLVERGDAVLGLRRLPPLRPRMGGAPLSRPPARRAAGLDLPGRAARGSHASNERPPPDRARQTPGRPSPGSPAMIHLTRRSTLAVLGGALAAPYVRRARAEDAVLNVYNWADYIGETTIADFERPDRHLASTTTSTPRPRRCRRRCSPG